MAAPTRTQIQADVTSPTFDVQVRSEGTWVSIAPLVAAVTTSVQAGAAFGAGIAPEASVEVDRSARAYEADRLPVRVRYGFGSSSTLVRFSGFLTDWSGRGAAATRTWTLRAADVLIEGAEVRTHALRRTPVFTRTTLTSDENPASSACCAGLGNRVLWLAGGRPWLQAAAYPDAAYYYDCAQALIAPEWTWAPGSDPWALLIALARAAGGQLAIDGEGVVRYADPITLATGAAAFTFTDEVLTAAERAAQNKASYADIEERRDGRRAITGATCTYLARRVEGDQIVYEQRDPQRIEVGGTATVVCDTQLPLYAVSDVAIDAAPLRNPRRAVAGEVTVAWTFVSAQRVTVTLTNAMTNPALIYGLRVRGRPIAAGEPGSGGYRAAAGRVVAVADSPFVQSARHAEMLARMLYDAEAAGGTTYALRGCAYDPDRAVGEIVALTAADLGLTAARCRIVDIRETGGDWMNVTLVPLGGLPTADTVHILGDVGATSLSLGY